MDNREIDKLKEEYLSRYPEVCVLDLPCLSCGSKVSEKCGKWARYPVRLLDGRYLGIEPDFVVDERRYLYVHRSRVAACTSINGCRQHDDAVAYTLPMRREMSVPEWMYLRHLAMRDDYVDQWKKKWR